MHHTINETISFWDLKLKKIREDIPIAGSPERCEFRIVIEDQDDRLFICEKISNAAYEHKMRIIKTLEFLVRQNLCYIHPYIQNKKGEYIAHNNHGLWQLIRFVDGVPLQRPEYVFHRWRGSVLADFLIKLNKKAPGLESIYPVQSFSITDYIYEVASEDALIIRGISNDETLEENVSVTVIATGFEPNSIIEPYKPVHKKEKVTLQTGSEALASTTSTQTEPQVIEVKKRKKLISDEDLDEKQGIIEFDVVSASGTETESDQKGDGTLRKLKHMQNILKKEGLSNKTMKDNIDEFEDVPAFVRKNIQIDKSDEKEKSEVSTFTLSEDDDEPVLRDDNAYLNDNVD